MLENEATIHEEALARIKWQCRRGMLELDMVLLPFVEKCFLDLSKAEQQNFTELLVLPDPILYQWIIGTEEPMPQYQELISKLRRPKD